MHYSKGVWYGTPESDSRGSPVFLLELEDSFYPIGGEFKGVFFMLKSTKFNDNDPIVGFDNDFKVGPLELIKWSD